MTEPSVLNLAQAKQILSVFNHPQTKPDPKTLDYAQIRSAVQLIIQHSDYQIFGICAPDYDRAIQALTSYVTALISLTYPFPNNPDRVEGPVYLKFNPNNGVYYINPYEGNERGVLISYQSANELGVNEMYGHLPLDLFADTLAKETAGGMQS
jgi:Domain of unknown function (DUF1824)